jgi:hypothetical protein
LPNGDRHGKVLSAVHASLGWAMLRNAKQSHKRSLHGAADRDVKVGCSAPRRVGGKEMASF